MHFETNLRSIVKAISWRFCATVITIVLVYIFTNKIILSMLVGSFEVVLKIIGYFLHERTWNYIPFGRKEMPHKSIGSVKIAQDQEDVKLSEKVGMAT